LAPEAVLATTEAEVLASLRSLRLEQKKGFRDGFGVDPTLQTK
jgi:hypothetical protein